MNLNKKHIQTFVKVNARVDEGLADLIHLMNLIDGLITLDCCQGYNGWGYVYFRYGNWRKLGKFLFETLRRALEGIEEIEYNLISIDGDEPMSKISFRAETIPQIVSALKKLVTGHKFECSHDRGYKAPHN